MGPFGGFRKRAAVAMGIAVLVVARAAAAVSVDCDTPDDFCTGDPCVTADSIEATNTATEEKVRTTSSDFEFTGQRINHTFPAHSFTQLEIALKK